MRMVIMGTIIMNIEVKNKFKVALLCYYLPRTTPSLF